MNYLDIIIFCILGLLVINGIRKGIILGVATLIALFLGIWAALHFSYLVSGFLGTTCHLSGSWVPALSFTITFLLVVTIIILLAKLLEKVVKTVGLSLVNRIFGGIFGLLKGILIVSVILFIIFSFDPKEKLIPKNTKETSFCYRYIQKAFPLMARVAGEKGFQSGH